MSRGKMSGENIRYSFGNPGHGLLNAIIKESMPWPSQPLQSRMRVCLQDSDGVHWHSGSRTQSDVIKARRRLTHCHTRRRSNGPPRNGALSLASVYELASDVDELAVESSLSHWLVHTFYLATLCYSAVYACLSVCRSIASIGILC